jgi:hypothetical protein
MKVYVIQLFATKSEEEALKLFKSLKMEGLPVRIDKVDDWYKIRIGNFENYGKAKKAFLDYNLDKGYITFIDYEPSRTILKSEEKVNNDEFFNQTTEQIPTSEQRGETYDDRNSTLSEEENLHRKSISEYKSLNKTEETTEVHSKRKPANQQIVEKKVKTVLISGKRKEEGMDFWSVIPLLILVVLSLLIVKLISKKMRKKSNFKVNSTMQTTAKKSFKEERKEMKREKKKEVSTGGTTDAEKKQPVPSEEGSILSYGKLIIGE